MNSEGDEERDPEPDVSEASGKGGRAGGGGGRVVRSTARRGGEGEREERGDGLESDGEGVRPVLLDLMRAKNVLSVSWQSRLLSFPNCMIDRRKLSRGDGH